MFWNKRVVFAVAAMTVALARADLNVDFEDLTLPDGESAFSGSYPIDGVGGTGQLAVFNSRGVGFRNLSDGDWGFWEGFAYSNMSDTATAGFANQFSAYTGTGFDEGDDIYAVGYVGFSEVPTVVFAEAAKPAGLFVTNTTWTALSMLNGDAFAKKFGGPDRNDPDRLVLTATGRNSDGAATGSADFLLADYTFADNQLDYVVDTWRYFDLSGLGTVKTIEFTMTSTDSGPYGMNTPAYFAIDNLHIVPEPAMALFLGLGAWLLPRRTKHACRTNTLPNSCTRKG